MCGIIGKFFNTVSLKTVVTRCFNLIVLTLSLSGCLFAQFNSGSTGTDGTFNPTVSQTLTVPESGVFNFTTVNIPSGVTIKFSQNSRNTPVTILASGNVVINGSINVDGESGASTSGSGGDGGPGGGKGGNSGIFNTSTQFRTGLPGDGPGGGLGGGNGSNFTGSGGCGGFSSPGLNSPVSSTTVNGANGPKYGLKSLVPLIGGSGGGGASSGNLTGFGGGFGGGGGGAVLIASSGSITFSSATISAIGGLGAQRVTGNGSTSVYGGSGSAGAIKLVANTISGSVTINIYGRETSGGFCYSAGGYLRIETFTGNLTLNLSSGAVPGVVSRSNPQPLLPANPPRIRIVSIGGITAPANPRGSFQDDPDIVVPTSQVNPVTVVLEGINIPLGTIVRLTLTPESGSRVITFSTALSGTVAASTATASIAIPDGVSVLLASATIDLTVPGTQPIFINGERVQSIELKSNFGGETETIYVLKSGKRVTSSEISR
jgi:hypothetical protein